MQTPAGRIGRVVAGIVLIGAGLVGVGGVPGYLMAVLGAVPLAAGLLDFCVMAPFFSVPFSGSKIRSMK
jgi:hypothetical protein